MFLVPYFIFVLVAGSCSLPALANPPAAPATLTLVSFAPLLANIVYSALIAAILSVGAGLVYVRICGFGVRQVLDMVKNDNARKKSTEFQRNYMSRKKADASRKFYEKHHSKKDAFGNEWSSVDGLDKPYKEDDIF